MTTHDSTDLLHISVSRLLIGLTCAWLCSVNISINIILKKKKP